MGDVLLRAVVVFCDDPEIQTKTDAFLAREPRGPEDDWFTSDPRKWVSAIGPLVNGYGTLILAPSGSKVGWQTDRDWLAFRERFIAFARTLDFANILSIDDYYDRGPNGRWALTEETPRA